MGEANSYSGYKFHVHLITLYILSLITKRSVVQNISTTIGFGILFHAPFDLHLSYVTLKTKLKDFFWDYFLNNYCSDNPHSCIGTVFVHVLPAKSYQ